MLGVTQEIVKLSDLREFYASSNGDRWLLGRRAGTREAFVVHQANVPSGGARIDLDLDAFLGRAPGSPQRDAGVGNSRAIEVSQRVCSKSRNCGSYFDLFRGFGGSSFSHGLLSWPGSIHTAQPAPGSIIDAGAAGFRYRQRNEKI